MEKLTDREGSLIVRVRDLSLALAPRNSDMLFSNLELRHRKKGSFNRNEFRTFRIILATEIYHLDLNCNRYRMSDLPPIEQHGVVSGAQKGIRRSDHESLV